MSAPTPRATMAAIKSPGYLHLWNSAGHFWPLVLLLVTYFFQRTAVAFFIDERNSPQQSDWSYDQQHEWQMEHKQCSLRAQSPIDIQRRFVIHNNQLKLHFYNYNQLTRFKIQNAHHTIKLNPVSSQHLGSIRSKEGEEGGSKPSAPESIPELIGPDDEIEPEFDPAPVQLVNVGANHHSRSQNSSLPGRLNPSGQIGQQHLADSSSNNQRPPVYNGAPTIKLDWLDDGNNEYKLQDIHFHWAERRDNGSEHAIDGKRAAMEMHLVHIKNGLDKSQIGYTSDSVAVIAVLIESYRKSNADFNPIVNALNRINMTQKPEEIEYKSIRDLLPNSLNNFFTYSGSLTTPPCYQVVNWVVMSDRLYLNAKQIEMFRNLYTPKHATPSSPTTSESHERHRFRSEVDNQAPHGEPALIMPNIRQLQPLNNRTILASFVPLSRLEQIQIFESPYSGASSVMSQLLFKHKQQRSLNNKMPSLICLIGILINAVVMMTTNKY